MLNYTPKMVTTMTTKQSVNTKPLWKAKDVADHLGVQVSTIYQWSREGYLPCILLGVGKKKSVRFNQADVEDWVVERSKSGRTSWVPEPEKMYE